jgi:hypothetical protein
VAGDEWRAQPRIHASSENQYRIRVIFRLNRHAWQMF